jgi:predicted MFS family arabinose efflux permease
VVAGGLLALIGWRLIFQMSAIPAVLFGLSIWLLLRRLPVQRREDTSFRTYLGAYRGALGRLLTNRRILGVLLVVAGFSATQAAVMTFLPIYLREDIGYSSIRAGVYLSAAQVVGIVSQPVMGFLSDRHGRKAVLLPGILILGVTVFSLYVAPADIPLLLAIVAMGAVLFPLMSILLAAAGDVAGEELQATTVGLVFASAVIFSGVSPLISGLLADEYGVKTVFLYGGGLATITAVVLGIQRWPGRRQE